MKKDRYLYLDVDSHTTVTRESNPDDKWDNDDTDTSWTVRGITLSDEDGYKAIKADFPVSVGDEVHVVYVVYSTGDSIGNYDNAGFEVVSFHKQLEVAEQNKRIIEQHERSRNLKVKLDSGKKIDLYCPWVGYFERLSYVGLESFQVSEK